MQALSKYEDLGRPLTIAEVDANWDAISTAVSELETGGLQVVGISLYENETGSYLRFLGSGGASLADIPFPAAVMTAGEWATGAAYTTRDIVTLDGGTYLCIAAHESGTFADDFSAGKWVQLGSGAASAVSFAPGDSGLTSTTMQGAVIELAGKVDDAATPAASAVTYDNTASGVPSTNVQAAIDGIISKVASMSATDVGYTAHGYSTVNDALEDFFTRLAALEGA